MLKQPEIEKKIDDLMNQMTLEEKIGQICQIGPSPVGGFEISEEQAAQLLKDRSISQATYEAIINHTMMDSREDDVRNGKVGSFIGIKDAATTNHLQKIAVEESRLGIPLIMGLDVIHGHKTIFPTPLAQACTFDDETFVESTAIAAKEAAEDGIHWTYAPMVDIARDSRWGRITEGVGEDAYLGYRYAAAMIRGFQGENLDELKKPEHIAACVKHFAGYGAAEGGRDYDTVDMSLAKFYESYLPPYAGAIKAGAVTAMAAFNDLNGSPCTTNKWLLTDLLRNKMGFEGFVISDAYAIQECVNHGTAKDIREAAKQAIDAGLDMDLNSNVYAAHMMDLIQSGEVSMETLDTAVRRILRVKYQCGLFEHPYTDIPETSSKLCKEHREAARRIAKKSIVLLKNDENILPLAKTAKLAVVGEIASNRDEMHGAWAVSPEWGTAVSLVDGLKSAGADFVYEKCVSETEPLDKELLHKTVQDADIVIAALSYTSAGEAHSSCKLELQGEQLLMLEELKKMGKKVVTLLFNGRPLALGNIEEYTDALVEAWHLGTEAGSAVCDVLFGDYNPSGRLTATVPYYSGQWPVYYNHPNTGRPTNESEWTCKYRDAPLTPLYCFGYGLSYTEFEYSNLELKTSSDELKATVTVKNIGKIAGEETIQLYIHRRNAVRVRPVKELKGYAKVFLQPEEEKQVTITVPREILGYFDLNAEYVTDVSEFDVWAAHDSDCRLGCYGTIIF